ncbi:MAG: hypothetical protein ACE5J7_00745 [Candidatus Aenigmatarchaeota archaeon]
MREKDKIVRRAAEVINTEPEQLINTIKKLQKEIGGFEKEISEA